MIKMNKQRFNIKTLATPRIQQKDKLATTSVTPVH